jgi:hypothetical protein
MKVKNNTLANLAVGAVSTRGKAAKNFMTVPGEATLELDDNLWLTEFAEPAAKMLEAGNLEIVEDVAKTEEQLQAEAEEKLEAARKLVATSEETKAAPTALKGLTAKETSKE